LTYPDQKVRKDLHQAKGFGLAFPHRLMVLQKLLRRLGMTWIPVL
jgi:hypothetical protein